MTRPVRYVIRMMLFLLAVFGVAGLLFGPLQSAFLANAPLNGLILGVLILGIGYNFRQVLMLYPEVQWIQHFRQTLSQETVKSVQISNPKPPRLLSPMASMVRARESFSLSAMAMRTLLDGIASRLDETRDISRYTIGLLIFLGLLGTFWGLLETVSSIGQVINGLSLTGNNPAQVFADLKQGLEAPMNGMGTAFSSSLFGLAGSLVLGFLDLQAGQAQNRFFNELEEWLSTVTRLSSGALAGDGEQSIPAYVQALLEQTAEGLESLQRILARSEENRIAADARVAALSERLATMTDHMKTEQSLMKSLAEQQLELRPILAALAQNKSQGGMDDATRTHIRNLDVYVGRMTQEMSSGRNELIQQVRSEIKLLARTIAGSSTSSNRE